MILQTPLGKCFALERVSKETSLLVWSVRLTVSLAPRCWLNSPQEDRSSGSAKTWSEISIGPWRCSHYRNRVERIPVGPRWLWRCISQCAMSRATPTVQAEISMLPLWSYTRVSLKRTRRVKKGDLTC